MTNTYILELTNGCTFRIVFPVSDTANHDLPRPQAMGSVGSPQASLTADIGRFHHLKEYLRTVETTRFARKQTLAFKFAVQCFSM